MQSSDLIELPETIKIAILIGVSLIPISVLLIAAAIARVMVVRPDQEKASRSRKAAR